MGRFLQLQRTSIPALLVGLAACGLEGAADEGSCAAAAGPRLVVTTTDFATGAVSVVDVERRCVRPDVALSQTDSWPLAIDGLVYLVHRFGFDYIDVLDPAADWELLAQHHVEVDGISKPNPHGLARGPDGLLWVPLYGAAEVQVLDLDGAAGLVDRIDLSAFADADGMAEATLPIVHGEELFVVVERLDQSDGFRPVDDDLLLVIDLQQRELVDLDPDEGGVQGMPLLGRWPRAWRPDPDRPGSRLLLGSGIQRVDLEARTTEWVLDESEMQAAGIDGPDRPLAFDVTPAGELFVAASHGEDWEVRIHRSHVDGSTPLTSVVEGLAARDQTLEIVGDELWFGDTDLEEPGMRAFDLDGTPLLDHPLPTGLPPLVATELR